MTPYIFQRGETIVLAIDTVTGDPQSVSAITACIKAVAPGRTSASADTSVAAAFVITQRAAVGDMPPGWNLTIDAGTSALLKSGHYLADARLVVAGGVIITESVLLSIRESVSA
jgi:hypothetical protein